LRRVQSIKPYFEGEKIAAAVDSLADRGFIEAQAN
jgi:hypothetical protein